MLKEVDTVQDNQDKDFPCRYQIIPHSTTLTSNHERYY